MPGGQAATRGRTVLSVRPEAPPWWEFTQGLLVAGCLAIAGLALLRTDADLKRSDWPSFMVAGRLAASQPQLLYDHDAELREQRAVIGPNPYLLPGYGGLLPVVTPPWTALYAAPFAKLGLTTGGRLWVLADLLALVAGGLLVTGWKEVLRPLAAFAGVPLVLLLGNAQLDGIMVLGLGLAWRLYASGREGWAGVALGLALVKPHLVLGVLAGLLAGRRWRALAGWAAAAAALAAASLVLAPGSLQRWPAAALLTAGRNGNDLSLPGLLYSVGADSRTAVLLTVPLALSLTVAAAARCRTAPVSAAALVLGGLLAAPHLLATDLVVACFAMLLAGLAAVGPLLLLSVTSLALALRIPPLAAALGGCSLLAGLLVALAGLGGQPRAPGIIGRQFGSR